MRQAHRSDLTPPEPPQVSDLPWLRPSETGHIRQLIGSDLELTEKKMFGGLAFLIRGNMAIAASSEGGAMVRVDPAQSDALVGRRRPRR